MGVSKSVISGVKKIVEGTSWLGSPKLVERFSDESRFSVVRVSGHQLIWRDRETRYAQKFVCERDRINISTVLEEDGTWSNSPTSVVLTIIRPLILFEIKEDAGIVLLFTCLSSFVAGDCPPPELIEPCTCKYPHDPAIVCSNITRMETITGLFERTGELRFKHFTLSHSTLQFLPAHALISKRVFGLTFENTTLTGLFDETPSSNNLVHMFVLDNVRIQRAIQWPMFQKLTKLRIMQLIGVTIKRLGKDFINNINQGLSDIFLSETRTTSLSDGLFENMKDLMQVAIIKSQIKTLKRNMFPRPAKLSSMNFM
ncbi:uncharacterized protein TNCV_3383851 [Trichonephila clavipes]|uniref:Uncharacterized protein n=1 Tax=Trichonephila clavipes TaxID=2585209 RepID=A0A8X6SYN0_TRICX|nr:uncharacterized protein TNCV_3383851 [Trichonephila clavipes]